jgi:HD-like signal output (HDOD) protein
MFRWLHSLFSGASAHAVPDAVPAPAVVPVVPPAPAPAATPPPPVPFERLAHVDGLWNGWLFDRPAGSLDLNDAEQRVLDALAAIVASRQSGAALVRRMPGLIPQLLQSLRSDNFPGTALARTIASDPVLVAAVVRLANSCFQSKGRTIASVEQAVILIGQEGLRQLITTVAFRPIIDLHSGTYTRRLASHLWAHSERCAGAARQVAAGAGDGSVPFDAFLAALLQNVGMIVSLRIMDGAAQDGPPLGSDVFLARLAHYTRSLGASIAREWHFPDTVAAALLEQGQLQRGAALSPLGRLLRLTDYLGKVRMLAEHGLVDGDDAALFDGLPPEAAQCYAALAEGMDGADGDTSFDAAPVPSARQAGA